MDPYLSKIDKRNNPSGNTSDPYFGNTPDPYWETIRLAMGSTRLYAMKMDLASATPQNSLSSTSFCLANAGEEYLVYNPESATSSFTVKMLKGQYNFEWYNPSTGKMEENGELKVYDGMHSFIIPFKGDAVLYIRKK